MINEITISSNGIKLIGHHHRSDKTVELCNPLIMILTGDSPKGIKSKTWTPLIEALLEAEFDVLSFDFHSQGYSEGFREELNLKRGCENFIDTYEAVYKNLQFGNRKIGLIGSSFGACVFLNSPEINTKFDAIFLKSPASFLAESYETEHGFPDGMKNWKKDKISEITGINYEAYIDSFEYNSYVNCSKINSPVLILHGDADDIVPIIQSRRLNHLIGDNSKLIELPGVKHDYKQEGASERLNQEAVSFFHAVFNK